MLAARGEHGDEGLQVRGAPGEDEAVAPTAQCCAHVVDDRLVAWVVGDHGPVDLSHASGCGGIGCAVVAERGLVPVSYTHLRAHETRHDLVCRLLLEKKKK